MGDFNTPHCNFSYVIGKLLHAKLKNYSYNLLFYTILLCIYALNVPVTIDLYCMQTRSDRDDKAGKEQLLRHTIV